MPSFEINIKTSDDPRGIENATEKTVQLTDAVGKLLERTKRKEEYAAAKEAINGLSAEEREAALSAYQLAKAQEQVDGTMGKSSTSAQQQTGLISSLKSSWIEMYGAIGVVKEVWQAANEVWDQTSGLFLDIASKGRTLQETIGGTAEFVTGLISVGDDLKISAESIQTAFEAAIRKGFDPSSESLARLRAEFQSIQDPVAQSKWLMDTFGRSGTDVRRIMQLDTDTFNEMMAAAKETGQVMTQEQLDQARAYEVAEDNLKDAWDKTKIRIGNEMIPLTTDLINADLERTRQLEEEHKWYLRIPGVSQIYTVALAAQEAQTRKNTAANNELNGSLAKTNTELAKTSRGNIYNSANYHAPGSEGYNPSGYVWTEGRAAGGPVRAGRMYSINENKPWTGPEYFIAPTDGQIIPGGIGQQGAGGIPVSFPFVYAPQFSLADQAEAERVFRPFVERAMRELGAKR